MSLVREKKPQWQKGTEYKPQAQTIKCLHNLLADFNERATQISVESGDIYFSHNTINEILKTIETRPSIANGWVYFLKRFSKALEFNEHTTSAIACVQHLKVKNEFIRLTQRNLWSKKEEIKS